MDAGDRHPDAGHPRRDPARAAVFKVDLSQRTGPVHHGANGALYGLSDDGVPSDNLLR